MEKPDLIIFDLGRVLIDFDFKKVVRELQKRTSLSQKEIHHFFVTTPLWDLFERGGIPPEQFFERLKKELKLKDLTFRQFGPIWNEIFTEKPDTVALLKRLRGKYRLALLSNVNIMHWEYVERQYPFLRWFDYLFTSCGLGYRKPNPEIFRAVLQQTHVSPTRAVFIDDVASHITSAQSLGIRAHIFTSAAHLRVQLQDLFK